MATTLKINRQTETIKVDNPDGTTACEWKIATDDASMEKRLRMVGDAMDRFAAIQAKIDKAGEDAEAAKEAKAAMARLMKRTVSAIIGADGWNDVLAYIGDGEPCDPEKNIANIGEVFAALVTWLYEHCTSKQLREVGVLFEREQKRTGGKWAPDNRASRRAKPKKRK